MSTTIDVLVAESNLSLEITPADPISLEVGLGVPLSAGALLGAYGSFYDTTNQTLVSANAAKVINIGTTSESNNVSVEDGTKVTFARKGVYNIQYSVQFVNTANEAYIADIWLSKGGSRVADTNSRFSVPSRKGQIYGHLIGAVNYILTIEEDEYVQLEWTAENTAVSIETVPAANGYPRTPGIIFTAQQVMYTQLGPKGDAATINIGTVTTVNPDDPATVTNSGTVNDAVFDFEIPQGEQGIQGIQGIQGDAATIQVGTVTTVEPTDPATVINSGTSNDAIFDFEIPKGEKGDQGIQGIQGPQGIQGIQGIQGVQGNAATIAVGTVTTVDPADPATVTNSGTSSAAVFDFEIPQGEDGIAATISVGTVTTVDPADPATVTNSGTSTAAVFDFEIPQGEKGDKGDKGDTGNTGPAGTNATPLTAIGYMIDGNGYPITTGNIKPGLRVPFSGTIESVTLFADQTGSIVLDIWKDSYGNYPPTVLDSICASAKPTLSSAIKSEDTTLAGWTKTITAGDVLMFNVDSASTVERVSVILKVTKT